MSAKEMRPEKENKMTDTDRRASQLKGIQPPPKPAEEGNLRAVKHAGYSEIVLAPLVEEMKKEILQLMAGEGLAHIKPVDQIAVGNLARCLARLAKFDAYLEEKGEVMEKDKINPVLKCYFTALESARRHCEALGLTPVSRARLGISLGQQWDFAKAMQEAEDVK